MNGLADIMADVHGHHHPSTFSPDRIRPEEWANQQAYRQGILGTPIKCLVEKH